MASCSFSLRPGGTDIDKPYFRCSETNSIACHGAPGVSNTAGIALWVVDYTLHASTLGIKQAFFHEGVGYKYNFVSA